MKAQLEKKLNFISRVTFTITFKTKEVLLLTEGLPETWETRRNQ
jgi:hypothetical protein